MEDLPKEKEKISAIRAARALEKVRRAKIERSAKRARWTDGHQSGVRADDDSN
jgi:hypothetical protein